TLSSRTGTEACWRMAIRGRPPGPERRTSVVRSTVAAAPIRVRPRASRLTVNHMRYPLDTDGLTVYRTRSVPDLRATPAAEAGGQCAYRCLLWTSAARTAGLTDH